MGSVLSFDEVLGLFGPATRHGKDYRVICPVHGDNDPSLDIADSPSGPLFYCRSQGCHPDDIIAAKGLTWRDITPSRNGHGHSEAWDSIYDYRDRKGMLRYRVMRRNARDGHDKVIRQQAADGTWSLKGIEPLPYKLPNITGDWILVAEGEKAVDAIWKAGIQATCNSGGAGNWRDSDTKALIDAGVTRISILPDNDTAGEKHAAKIEESARRLGLKTDRIILPGLPPKGDAYDWLQLHTDAEFVAALTPEPPPKPPMLTMLDDAVDVAEQGQKIADDGISYLIEDIIPDYGMLGFLVAKAKVGKSTLAQHLAAAVATGTEFLGRETKPRRVLVIAAEDPPEYVAWMARYLKVPRGRITFSRAPLQLNEEGIALIVNTVIDGGYGLVLIASWQAVVSSLVKDENDNAGSVIVVERVKIATRHTHIPWLVDGHAGKSEDQSDEADPMGAMRGASSAAGAADFMLSLRYMDNNTFSTQRRISGKGRFVYLEPMVIDYAVNQGTYTVVSEKMSELAETTWAVIVETNAITHDWAGAGVIASLAGFCATPSDISGATRRKIHDALFKRQGVDRQQVSVKGKTTWHFRRSLDAGDD